MVQTTDARGTVRRLVALLRPERARITLMLCSTVLSVAMTVYGPRLLGRATDLIVEGLARTEGLDRVALRSTLLTAAAIYVIGASLSWLVAYLMHGVVNRSMARLRGQVEDKVHRLPLSHVDRTPRGDLLSRVTNDIDNLAQSLQMSVSQALNQVLMITGVLVMMLWISPILALFAVLLIPTSIKLVRVIMARSRTRFGAQWRHTGELNSIVEESFTGHSLVKVFGRQAEVEARFAEVNDELYDASWRAQFIVGTTQPSVMFLGNLNYLVVAVVGSLRITSGAMTIGELQAFIQYSRLFTQPLTALASMMNMLQSGLASAERVFELLDAPDEDPDPSVEDAPALPVVRGRVEFDGVSFSYSPDSKLIEDLSLVAEPGQTIAIVGPTGAGKTTLVNLIMRFYEIDGGSITLDGIDIRELRREQLREKIGMVLQDTWLFEGTIWDNLRYGDLDAPDEAVLAAARAAYVDRFVHTLPDGYETVVDEDGGNLSAGEKQLLTIARAFLNDPSILILDEATSSVDTRTEVLIQEAMAALRSQRTSFVIAHRLSTIRDADTILMMEDGRIVEQGSHEELIEARGAYFRLYQSQFSAPVVDVDEELPPTSGTGGPPGPGGPGGGPPPMRPPGA
ncbi:ABC transporter ATP-binding protein [Actinomarinicola tropica]|uniref:Fatty acid ABC transporter ATP-binding/permease protein n=1 Tax=Actinomarinicola tropica TaxID=2789776 RepID=A0A5Q2RST1_9ACTN|nr:ATP-binding cassette domain-containing protein [Actinomarinicola tropica]